MAAMAATAGSLCGNIVPGVVQCSQSAKEPRRSKRVARDVLVLEHHRYHSLTCAHTGRNSSFWGTRNIRTIAFAAGSSRRRILTMVASTPETVVSQEVEFQWSSGGRTVLLTGTFFDWEKKVKLAKGEDGVFRVKQRLPPGTHQYKFVVDGEWVHSVETDVVADGIGGLNNVITIKGPTPESGAAPPETASEPKGAPKTEATPAPPAAKGPGLFNLFRKSSEQAPAAVPTPSPKPEAKPAAKVEAPAEAPPAAKPVAKAAAPAAKEEPSVGAAKASAGAGGAPTAKPVPKKPVKKTLPQVMEEDIVPQLRVELDKANVTDVDLVFEQNQLRGSFTNGGVPYSFWAYFPDGTLEGTRGFAVSSHGYPPSTVEPFYSGEPRITPEMLVFWISKRLFTQKSALPKLN